jgi:hypothetical protein
MLLKKTGERTISGQVGALRRAGAAMTPPAASACWVRGLGYIVENSAEARKQLSLIRLRSFCGDPALRRHIRQILRLIGTRYVGKNLHKDRKSVARALMEAGGPKQFFSNLGRIRSERVPGMILILQRLNSAGPPFSGGARSISFRIPRPNP